MHFLWCRSKGLPEFHSLLQLPYMHISLLSFVDLQRGSDVLIVFRDKLDNSSFVYFQKYKSIDHRDIRKKKRKNWTVSYKLKLSNYEPIVSYK